MTGASSQMAALGDATRRRIFELLSAQPSSVEELARKLPVTRPAVSQHLRVLKDVRLVKHRAIGTKHIYQLDPEGIARLRAYLDSAWEMALGEFKTAAEKPEKRRPKK